MQLTINVHGGDVQNVFSDIALARIVVVNWDVDASKPGEPGIVDVEMPDGALNASVREIEQTSINTLAGSETTMALQAARDAGLLDDSFQIH